MACPVSAVASSKHTVAADIQSKQHREHQYIVCQNVRIQLVHLGTIAGLQCLHLHAFTSGSWTFTSCLAYSLNLSCRFMTPELPAAVMTGRRIMFIGRTATIGACSPFAFTARMLHCKQHPIVMHACRCADGPKVQTTRTACMLTDCTLQCSKVTHTHALVSIRNPFYLSTWFYEMMQHLVLLMTYLHL